MDALDIVGSIIGLVYLFLEYRASVWLWLAGIVMPAVYVVVFYSAGLYADMALNIYLIGASLYGVLCWLRERNTLDGKIKIAFMPSGMYVWASSLSVILTVALYLLLHRFTDSTVPFADGFTTALSIVAMWMLARRWAEQWLVWFLVDIVSSVLYFIKDLPFTSGLYLLYSAIAIVGYRKWRAEARCSR